MKAFPYLLAICWLGIISAFSDTVVLNGGSTIEATIIQTNGGIYVLLTDDCTYRVFETSVKEIRQEAEAPVATQKDARLSDFRRSVLSLARQTWSSNLVQIPATVIDKGVLKNVPYVSFRCSDDYEVNIYGDLTDPAAIEAGVYRKLLNDDSAKRNCLKFIIGLLSQPADKEVLQSLSMERELKNRNGLNFEVTPPTAEDAYLGWWISVYSEEKLTRSRASEAELANISVPKTNTAPTGDSFAWSADDMKLARSQPETAMGVYSSDEFTRQLAEQSRQLAEQSPYVAPISAYVPPSGSYVPPSSSYVHSSGGSVYVRGYTRKDGTYVAPHTRSAPRR